MQPCNCAYPWLMQRSEIGGYSREDEGDWLPLHSSNFVECAQIFKQIGGAVRLCDGDLEGVCPCTDLALTRLNICHVTHASAVARIARYIPPKVAPFMAPSSTWMQLAEGQRYTHLQCKLPDGLEIACLSLPRPPAAYCPSPWPAPCTPSESSPRCNDWSLCTQHHTCQAIVHSRLSRLSFR